MSAINVNLLSYYKPENSLSAELSTLEANGHEVGRWISVKSHKTNKTVIFHYAWSEQDRDGDITAHVYLPIGNNPISKLTLFND